MYEEERLCFSKYWIFYKYSRFHTVTDQPCFFMENGMFWSEIGSGFGESGGTPPPRITRSTLPGHLHGKNRHSGWEIKWFASSYLESLTNYELLGLVIHFFHSFKSFQLVRLAFLLFSFFHKVKLSHLMFMQKISNRMVVGCMVLPYMNLSEMVDYDLRLKGYFVKKVT